MLRASQKHRGAGASDLIGLHKRIPTGSNYLVAGLGGALIALALAYVASYLQTRYGFGVVGTKGSLVVGPEVFARAGLNLYTLHHILLIGAGQIRDAFGNVIRVSASIALPLTVWTVLPLAALLIGGFAAGTHKANAGRGRALVSGLCCGIIYGVTLGCLAPIMRAKLDFFLLPEVGGLVSNPPPVDFRPSAISAVVNGCGFGIAFAMLGALLATRHISQASRRDKWWVCGKAVFVVVVVAQLLIGLALLGYIAYESEPTEDSNQRIMEMLPAACGLAYTMAHGATLLSSVESRFSGGPVQKPFYAQADLYGVIKKGKDIKPIPPVVRVAALVFVLAIGVAAGRLAVRWGSADGSLPTGFRCAVLHTAYLALLPQVCSLFLHQSDPVSSVSISISASLGWRIWASFGCILTAAVAGAHSYSRGRLSVESL